jgi:hypothetical protein
MDSKAIRTGWILVVFGSVLMLYVAVSYALSAVPFFPVPFKWIGFAAMQIFPVAAASAVAAGGMLLYRWRRGPRTLRILGILMIVYYVAAYVWMYVRVLMELHDTDIEKVKGKLKHIHYSPLGYLLLELPGAENLDARIVAPGEQEGKLSAFQRHGIPFLLAGMEDGQLVNLMKEEASYYAAHRAKLKECYKGFKDNESDFVNALTMKGR